MLVHLLWLLSQTISTFVFEWCCFILWLRFFCIRPHFWRYSAPFYVQYISSQESRLECMDGFYGLRRSYCPDFAIVEENRLNICSECFHFCFCSSFFVIKDDFQLVSCCNCDSLSSLYVFTRVQYASEISTQSPFVVGSVYITYSSVLSWFTLRSLDL